MAIPLGPGGGYNTDQMLGLAYLVGWRGSAQIVAVCIAHAESSFIPGAVGHNGPTAGCPHGSRDRGLWQINDCYHPSVSDRCAFDPVCNAKAAYPISNGGQDFGAWSTYTSGIYRAYLAETHGAYSAGRWQHWVGQWGPGGVLVVGTGPQGAPEWTWDQHVKRSATRISVSSRTIHATGRALFQISKLR